MYSTRSMFSVHVNMLHIRLGLGGRRNLSTQLSDYNLAFCRSRTLRSPFAMPSRLPRRLRSFVRCQRRVCSTTTVPSSSSSSSSSSKVDTSSSSSASNAPPKSPKLSKSSTSPITILDIHRKYRKGKKLSMITAYDYSSARSSDNAGIDMILVGDSVGMVVMGHTTTVPVSLRDIIHHSRAVRRGTKRAYIIGDLPFGTFLSVDDAIHNAASLIQHGRCDAVKLEGGRKMVNQIKAIVDSGIPVCGHIGLTPQTASALGGYRVQGKTASAALALYQDALALQEAGCVMIVMECVPSTVASYITSRLNIPTIGIGAGSGTSGQVQVFHDMVGLFDKFTPKFSKRYAEVGKLIESVVSEYRTEVEEKVFPAESHSFSMKDDQYRNFLELVEIFEQPTSTPEPSLRTSADLPHLGLDGQPSKSLPDVSPYHISSPPHINGTFAPSPSFSPQHYCDLEQEPPAKGGVVANEFDYLFHPSRLRSFPPTSPNDYKDYEAGHVALYGSGN
uniref:3-methyl-2-oxobutanoate hydroxymethyltransferase n=2 Tax=Hirondellea gigas TaxID=1518452 RepID=A0A6A7FSC2_9CRUS